MAGLNDKFLAPPVLASIRNEEVAARVRMERTASQEIREERADLKEAAEQSLNVVVDLSLDGSIRWVSPSWKTVVGTPLDAVPGKAISDVLVPEGDGVNPFLEAMESMKQDDSKSQIIRFKISLGPSSIYFKDPNALVAQKEAEGTDLEDADGMVISMEGQGIMVHDLGSKGSSHVSCSAMNALYKVADPLLDHVDAPAVC